MVSHADERAIDHRHAPGLPESPAPGRVVEVRGSTWPSPMSETRACQKPCPLWCNSRSRSRTPCSSTRHQNHRLRHRRAIPVPRRPWLRQPPLSGMRGVPRLGVPNSSAACGLAAASADCRCASAAKSEACTSGTRICTGRSPWRRAAVPPKSYCPRGCRLRRPTARRGRELSPQKRADSF